MPEPEEKILLEREITMMIQQQRQVIQPEAVEGGAPGETRIGGLTIIPHTVNEPEEAEAARDLMAVEQATRENMGRLVDSLVASCDAHAAAYRPWKTFLDTIEPDVIESYPMVIERLRQRYAAATMPKAENWATHVIMDVLGLTDGLDQEIPDY